MYSVKCKWENQTKEVERRVGRGNEPSCVFEKLYFFSVKGMKYFLLKQFMGYQY